MKTTIKTSDGQALTVQGMRVNKVIMLDAIDSHGNMVNLMLEPDQVGVLLFALEQEAEALGVEL